MTNWGKNTDGTCINGQDHETFDIEEAVRYNGWTDYTNEKSTLEIRFWTGFEAYNTRPYHNYESWGSGWRVTDLRTLIMASSECIFCALDELREKVDAANGRRLE